MRRLLDQLASTLGARRDPSHDAPASTSFAAFLAEYERDTEQWIVGRWHEPDRFESRLPPGWRPEDIIGGARAHGFVSVSEAARQMWTTEDEVVALARAGLLEADGGLVRPAVVSVLASQRSTEPRRR